MHILALVVRVGRLVVSVSVATVPSDSDVISVGRLVVSVSVPSESDGSCSVGRVVVSVSVPTVPTVAGGMSVETVISQL